MFSLRQLRIFATVAERENLAAAGRVLLLSLPTMSEALRNLEAQLGQPLFDRSSRRLKLNAAGHAFLRDARALLDQGDALYRRHKGRRQLIIGASVTLANYILPPTIVSIAKRYPDLHVDVIVRNTEDIIKMMLRRRLQAALVEGSVFTPELDTRVWQEDELAIIAPPGHSLTKGATDDDLAKARWILRERGSGTRESFDQIASMWADAPHIVMTAGGNELIKQAVAAGLGLGCLSYAAVRAEVGGGTLALVPNAHRMTRTLSFVRARGVDEDGPLQILMEHLGLAAYR